MANLERAEPELVDLGVATFRQHFLNLPPELRDRVFTFVGSFDEISPRCKHLLPQYTWKNVLVSGRYIPFLWDLDLAGIARNAVHDTRQH